MQLIKTLEIQSKQRIIDFLNSEPVDRISTIDVDGHPQVIPMNFVYVQAIDPHVQSRRIIKIDAIYMHSHPLREKLDNIKRNSKVGFEVDKHVCYLPPYIHPSLKLILFTLVWLSKEMR